jgi:trans-aconitate methyltransferase
MIELAKSHLGPKTEDRVRFEATDLFAYAPDHRFEMIFSNATMHWLLPANGAYSRLSQLLVPGGHLVVCQGGRACYMGLWQLAAAILKEAGVSLEGWHYPAFYPTQAEMEEMLRRCGFVDIKVVSWESDGEEMTTLYKDFASAGLLPFARLLPEGLQDGFRAEFVRRAEVTQPARYTHRIVASARRS